MGLRYKQLQFDLEILRIGSPEWAADKDLGVRMNSLFLEKEQAVAFLPGGHTWLSWFMRFELNAYLKKTRGWVLVGYTASWTAHGPLLSLRLMDAEGKQNVAFISAQTWNKVFRDLIYLVKTNNLKWKKDKFHYENLARLHEG